MLDTDRSGALTFIELREAFDIILKMNLSEEEFEAAASEMDKDSDGSVHFPEFKKYFVSGVVAEYMCFCGFIDFVSIFFCCRCRNVPKRKERKSWETDRGEGFWKCRRAKCSMVVHVDTGTGTVLPKHTKKYKKIHT